MEDSSHSSSFSTLYVNNINEKVAINKIKYVLTKLFKRYGIVVGVTAHRNLKMKGQAFITYKDRKSCEKAIVKLQGRPVFKKPINVFFSKLPSDLERELMGDISGITKRKAVKFERNAAESETKRSKPEDTESAVPAQLSKAQIKQWQSLPPHNVLLLQNVEESLLESTRLEGKFGTFAGFSKVRLIKFRKLAFIDFQQVSAAIECLAMIDHEQFGPSSLLSYAKK